MLNDARAYQGQVQAVSDAGIKVSLATGEVTFARQDILRVSYKTGSSRVRHVAIWAAIGGGIGALIGAIGCSERCASRGGLLGGLIFAAGGAIDSDPAWRVVYRTR